MKLKIMITGKNKKIALDLAGHLEGDRGYKVIKCEASMDTLFDAVPLEIPDVIIICLGNETKESVKVYNALAESTNADWIKVIVVANEEDTNKFTANTGLRKMMLMPRPVSLAALYSKLVEIENSIDENNNKVNSLIKEYVNPNAQKTIRRKHVLVVDDDQDQLMQIKEHLSEFYEVTVVRSGEAAFKYLDKHKVDIILLDYVMPQPDGPKVLASLKSNKEFSSIPVVFLTGVSERDKVLKTIVELKPQGYLVKPAKKSEIVAKIIDILG